MEQKKLTGYPSIDKPWLKYYSKEAINKYLPKCSINEYLWKHNKDNLDDVALVYFGRKYTYKELFKNIDEAANMLFTVMKVRENSRILYLMPNIPETAFLLYGSSKIGAVSDFVDPRPDSIDPKINGKKILQIIEDEHIDHIVALEQCYLGIIAPVEKEIKALGISDILIVSATDSMNGLAKLVYMKDIFTQNSFHEARRRLKQQQSLSKKYDQAKSKSVLNLIRYSDAIQTPLSEITPVNYKENRLEIIVHTSGTSSAKPKPIPLTNDNLNAYVHQTFIGNMPMKRGDKALHILPYFAAFGVVDVVHAGLCHGNCLIQIPEFSPKDLSFLIKEYHPQILIGAPTWFQTLFDDKSLEKENLSFFSMLTYGGDSMTEADEIRINKFLHDHHCDVVLTKGHGMSETCGCASYATGEYNRIGGIGIPMPNTIYAVVDPETKEMIPFDSNSDYIEGELIISSPVVTEGILDGKVIVPSMVYNGERYIFTRDIARMYRNGSMKFLTRSDRSFTRYDGYKIKPYVIEEIIKHNTMVRECILVPYFDQNKKGLMPIAHLLLTDSRPSAAEEVKKLIEDIIFNHIVKNPEISSRQIPSRFRIRESLPLTKNSKVDINALAGEGISDADYLVEIEETNLNVGNITIKAPDEV